MVKSGSPLTAEDIDRLARLHRGALPTSVLGRMGAATLRRYYRWVAGSPLEWLFADRVESVVAGAAVVSFEPASLIRRFVMHSPVMFLAALVAALAADGMFRREVVAYLRERAPDDAGAKPELLQIFVAPDRQGKALGTILLDKIGAALAERGVSVYWVRTLQENNLATLAFYRKRGFEDDARLRFCGEPYILLKKTLRAGAR